MLALTTGAVLIVAWAATRGGFFFLQQSPIRCAGRRPERSLRRLRVSRSPFGDQATCVLLSPPLCAVIPFQGQNPRIRDPNATSKTSLHQQPIICYSPSANFSPIVPKSLKALFFACRFVVPVLVLAFVVIYELNRRYYIYLTLEDNVVEWVTVGFLLVSGVLGLVLAVRSYRMRKGFALFFGVFGVFCILCALEEISWGQRIFHIKSPSFFLEKSAQREINVHNVIQKRFNLKTKHIAGLVLFAYGVCLPLLLANRKIERLVARCGLVVPPVALSFSFLIAAVMMFDWPTGQEEELGELFFAICFFFFMASEYLRAPENTALGDYAYAISPSPQPLQNS